MLKGLSRCGMALLTLTPLMMAAPQMSSAFVDPGTGSMLWQIAAAVVIGSLFYVRRAAGWIRSHPGLVSARRMGFLFALIYALAASPLTIQFFSGQFTPRFNDIFLVGIALTAYFFTWESASFLLVISILVSAWILPPYGSLRVEGLAEWYRLASFTGVSVLLICLITRLKVRQRLESEPEPEPRRVEMRVMAAGR